MIRLSNSSLKKSAYKSAIERILNSALNAVDPFSAVMKNVIRDGDQLQILGRTYGLRQFRRIIIIGAGKAGHPMAQAISTALDGEPMAGIVIVKHGHAATPEVGSLADSNLIKIHEAGHPVPDQQGIRGTQEIIEYLAGCGEQDLVICLISGGGSALMHNPVEGVSLEDLQAFTELMLSCGADIYEINAIRKHLDRVKGGQLAKLAAPATIVSLILSDVIGDPLDVIASGPTVPDSTTFDDAYGILVKYSILDRTPESITTYLTKGIKGEVSETPKASDPIFDNTHNVIIGNNLSAARAALKQCQTEGFNSQILTTHLRGEARSVGPLLATILKQIAQTGDPIPRPACLICGGETTVTLRGDGKGGRNQELALSAVEELAGLQDTALLTLATDGGDGPTDAAGAVVTGETLENSLNKGLHPQDFLARNDAYHYFEPLGELIITGPTLTNVNDLTFLFAL